jgi:hypothetical protein
MGIIKTRLMGGQEGANMGAFSDLDEKLEKTYEKGKEKVKEGMQKTGDKIEHATD